jgi:hypothetical protein
MTAESRARGGAPADNGAPRVVRAAAVQLSPVLYSREGTVKSSARTPVEHLHERALGAKSAAARDSEDPTNRVA